MHFNHPKVNNERGEGRREETDRQTLRLSQSIHPQKGQIKLLKYYLAKAKVKAK